MPKYKNADLQNNLLPTLAQMKKYIKNAIQTDAQYRDVRQLMSFLQRLPQVDSYLLGLMQTRKIAMLGFPYTIKFPEDIKVDASEEKKTCRN